MSDLNSATFTGRVSQNAETKTVGQKGTLITTFQLLNQTGFGPYQKTNLITVKIWGKYGESLAPSLTIGTQVGATGELVCSLWKGQQYWDLMARSVTFIAPPTSPTQATTSSTLPNGEPSFEGVEF